MERKQEMMENLKHLIYAHDEQDFSNKLITFKASIANVEVRSLQKYVSLDQYFTKNWLSCTEMWAKYMRRHLPLMGDHTNNRIERSFWTLKRSISESFPSLPETGEALMHLVALCDERLKSQYARANLRTLRIFSKDKKIQMLNEEASKVLNDRGCL